MVYKTLVDIGEFKAGELVPDEKGEIWSKMYKVSPVEKIREEPKLVESEPEPEVILPKSVKYETEDVNKDGTVDLKDVVNVVKKSFGKKKR